MSIVCLSWSTAHLHGAAWASHHRLRHRVFCERQGWQVPSVDGMEYDEFDTPAARYIIWLDGFGEARGVTRLIPTTRPYMVEKLWPDLIERDLPRSPVVWEATRFACDRDLAPDVRRQVVAELICACQEFGVANGIQKYLGVMPLSIFKCVIAAAGCPVTYVGTSRQMGRHAVAAAYIGVSPRILATVRARTRIARPVLPTGLALVA